LFVFEEILQGFFANSYGICPNFSKFRSSFRHYTISDGQNNIKESIMNDRGRLLAKIGQDRPETAISHVLAMYPGLSGRPMAFLGQFWPMIDPDR
jgi:hypothetical protein